MSDTLLCENKSYLTKFEYGVLEKQGFQVLDKMEIYFLSFKYFIYKLILFSRVVVVVLDVTYGKKLGVGVVYEPTLYQQRILE